MSRPPDPFEHISFSRVSVSQASAQGWPRYQNDRLSREALVRGSSFPPWAATAFDVCVIGSGPGGSTVAEYCARRGMRTLLIEEGPFLRAQTFSQAEAAAARLYQDGMARRTRDESITILQGRLVGGSAALNWTSSFRTPERTLEHWQAMYGVDLNAFRMNDRFASIEERLGISLWDTPNGNNDRIRMGCRALGWHWGYIPRNVQGCWNLGLCGLGCPTNAKQTALTVMLPQYLDHGGYVLADSQATRLLWRGRKVRAVAVQCSSTGLQTEVTANQFVLAGGAIGTPVVLLRSGAPDPFGRLGRRTFLHPVVCTFAQFDESIEPYAGAPQSVYSDEHLWPSDEEACPGFKIEAMPLLPMFASGLSCLAGPEAYEVFGNLRNMQACLALQRDGFAEESQGGVVSLDGPSSFGGVGIDYPLGSYQMRGFRRALRSMAEVQFAAGARRLIPLHSEARWVSSMKDLDDLLSRLPWKPHALRVGSAHVMGGCSLSSDPRMGVADLFGRHHQLRNLTIADGSLFPTSLGANPQLTIFALAQHIAEAVPAGGGAD
jgi:choline dehydrogenase-like flavoprotein